MKAIHVLLRNAIDYAGLFPPAALDMEAAVENYAEYRRGGESWALGRFVVPAGRLSEFSHASNRYDAAPTPAERWQLAALAGSDLDADLAAIEDFNQRSPLAQVDTLEVKSDSAERVGDIMRRLTGHLQTYVEIPVDRDPTQLLAMIRRMGGRAKVRTGGITRDAFPTSSTLIRFVAACVRSRVPFKATAGLHHPVRAEYRLTYAPDSERSPMFGFLNLFLAAAFLHVGMDEQQAEEVLQESSPAAIRIEEEAISWKGRRLDLHELRQARQEVMVSFGSCSFTEPLSELQSLQPLGPRVQQA
ncbi:MAG TPA: hypothetical protein VE282_03605 [Gemmatimonadales bacterium]|nr:hypothetical protein [Gemmatimonadales bacterium]